MIWNPDMIILTLMMILRSYIDLNEVEGSLSVTAETVAGRLPLLYFGSNVV